MTRIVSCGSQHLDNMLVTLNTMVRGLFDAPKFHALGDHEPPKQKVLFLKKKFAPRKFPQFAQILNLDLLSSL